MKLVNLTYAIMEINAAVDTGKYDDISLEVIKRHMEEGDVLDFVQGQAKGDIDLTLLDDETKAEITEGLQDILYGYGGQERRKWGIENKGLCLLIAWLNELVQQRRWKD